MSERFALLKLKPNLTYVTLSPLCLVLSVGLIYSMKTLHLLCRGLAS